MVSVLSYLKAELFLDFSGSNSLVYGLSYLFVSSFISFLFLFSFLFGLAYPLKSGKKE